MEGVAVEEGLEGGGDGVKVLLRADFAGGHCIGENLLPERHFFLHNLVIAFSQVRIVALDLQDEEKVGVGGILWQSLTDSIQIVCPGVDNALKIGLDEVLEGHTFRVIHFVVDVLLFQYLADDDLAEEVQFGLGIIEDGAAGEARGLFNLVQSQVTDVAGEQQREGLGEELLLIVLSHCQACAFLQRYALFSLCLHTIWYVNNILFSIFALLVSRTLKQMETIKTELYEAPTTTVIEVKAEGAILVVSGDAPQYEGPYDF